MASPLAGYPGQWWADGRTGSVDQSAVAGNDGPLDQATWTGRNGVRYQNPEIVLLSKARHVQGKDETDFPNTVLLLNHDQLRWLIETLPLVHP